MDQAQPTPLYQEDSVEVREARQTILRHLCQREKFLKEELRKEKLKQKQAEEAVCNWDGHFFEDHLGPDYDTCHHEHWPQCNDTIHDREYAIQHALKVIEKEVDGLLTAKHPNLFTAYPLDGDYSYTSEKEKKPLKPRVVPTFQSITAHIPDACVALGEAKGDPPGSEKPSAFRRLFGSDTAEDKKWTSGFFGSDSAERKWLIAKRHSDMEGTEKPKRRFFRSKE